jgi:YL1 protein
MTPKSSSTKRHATTVTGSTKHDSEYTLYKNSSYASKVEAKRKRWKSLKQIIDGIINSKREGAGLGVEEEGGVKQQSKKKKRKSDKASSLSSQVHIMSDSNVPMEQDDYVTIAVAPSTLPPLQHYCDITGLPTQYHDPRTGLYYKDASVFAAIRACSTQRVQQYLGLRNAGVNI